MILDTGASVQLRLDDASFDVGTYLDVVETAGRAPAWVDRLITTYSAYGLVLFAFLMLLAWWQARHRGPRQALTALVAPLLAVLAFAVSSGLKALLHEARPCRSLHVLTLEACPAPGDWSFPSNHATLAAASAVALWSTSRRLGAIATLAALAMAASRVWVGAHYPHDVAVGLVVGALVAGVLGLLFAVRAEQLARRLGASRLRPLVAS